jgi:hypothetical protein
MFTIYIVDRANQLSQQTFGRQEDADAATDRWEAVGGCEVYTNRLAAVLAKDGYDRFTRRQSQRASSCVTSQL